MQTNTSAHPQNETPASTPKRPGRPTLFCAEVVALLCSLIAEYGMSDSAAAATAKVPPSTLSRWKDEHPGLAEDLAAARETFRIAQIEMIREAHTRDGRRDWRAAAWLLIHVFPEDYGRRSSRPSPPLSSEPECASSVVPAPSERSEITETPRRQADQPASKPACNITGPRLAEDLLAPAFQNFRNVLPANPAPLAGPIATAMIPLL